MRQPDDHVRAASPLLELRRGVDDLHRKVEHRLGLLADPLDPGRYADALVALERVLGPIETTLGDRVDWSSARLTPLLRTDIDDLGRTPGSPVRWDGDDRPGGRWGARYVIEGSRLGATVVEPHLRNVLPSAPRRYFRAAAAGAAPRWARFRSAAAEALVCPREVDAAVESARAVFEALLGVLAREHDERAGGGQRVVPTGSWS